MIRLFDIVFSIIGIILLLPLFLIIYLLIVIESKGSGFYLQNRVGRNDVEFRLIKFRSMRIGSDKKGLITVGGYDTRMTRIGIIISHLKLDELPQLLNIIKGEMSLVGPRPEVPKYVALYNSDQMKVLSVRPGITDYASIEYVDENVILGKAANPERTYVEEIMPHKIRLNMKYINNQSVMEYFKIIFLTFWKIIKKG